MANLGERQNQDVAVADDSRRASDKASTNSLTSRVSNSDRGQWV
jgi:hypothetical protein